MDIYVLTVEEFARMFKVSTDLVHKCVREEGMPVFCKAPVRLDETSIEWFKERQTKKVAKKGE